MELWSVNLLSQIFNYLSGFEIDRLIRLYPNLQNRIKQLEDLNQYHLTKIIKKAPRVIKGHCQSVKSVAWSPDGSKLASGSYIGTIGIWDPATGKIIWVPLKCHNGWVFVVVWSPDGSKLASSSQDRTIRIWDPKTGQLIGNPLTGHTNSVVSLAWSPDGSKLASGSHDRTIRIWDARSGDETDEVDGETEQSEVEPTANRLIGEPLTGHTNSVWSLAWSPDGSKLASGSDDGTIRIWDPKTGQLIGNPLTGHTDWVNSVAWSPDGSKLASGSSDGIVRIWDPETGGETEQSEVKANGETSQSEVKANRLIGDPLIGHTDWVNSVAWSPDGSKLASGSFDRTIRIWNPETRQLIENPLRGHTNSINSLAWSPDGSQLASGSDDRTIRIWNI